MLKTIMKETLRFGVELDSRQTAPPLDWRRMEWQIGKLLTIMGSTLKWFQIWDELIVWRNLFQKSI